MLRITLLLWRQRNIRWRTLSLMMHHLWGWFARLIVSKMLTDRRRLINELRSELHLLLRIMHSMPWIAFSILSEAMRFLDSKITLTMSGSKLLLRIKHLTMLWRRIRKSLSH